MTSGVRSAKNCGDSSGDQVEITVLGSLGKGDYVGKLSLICLYNSIVVFPREAQVLLGGGPCDPATFHQLQGGNDARAVGSGCHLF